MTELLVVVAIVGILAAGAMAMVSSKAVQGVREVRASQDQKVLNSAVLAYITSGGDITVAKNAGEVLAKLRTSATNEQRRRIPGLSGSFLDPSVQFVVQTDEEAKRESPRLHWNPKTSRFNIAFSGPPGIISISRRDGGKENPATDQSPPGENVTTSEPHEHRLTPFSYADKSTWVWDYADVPLTFPDGPSALVTSLPEDNVPPSILPLPPSFKPPVVPTSTLPPSTPSPPASLTTLAAPRLSLPGGRYPSDKFNLSLSLHDQNPAGAAFLFYSLSFGEWQAYSGPISVPPGSTIKAQATPVNPLTHRSSAIVEAVYEAFKAFNAMLLPPGIEFNKAYFETGGSNSIDNITVRLTNPNRPGVSELVFQLVPIPGGSGPTTDFRSYEAPFAVSSRDYPSGFGVRAVTKSKAPGYLDSRPASRLATAQTTLFGGHLDLDTSTSISTLGNGSTTAHSHDILKAGGTSINFFAIPEGEQVEIQEAIPNPSQRFKLTIVNGALSPGMNLVIDYDLGGVSHTVDMPVNRYGQLPVGELPVFSLGNVPGAVRLRALRFSMAQDLIYQAGIIPTNTGEVRSNVPGKDGEWRNGALTLQALAVNSNGSPAHTLDPNRSNGSHGSATSGLLWEAAVFWHWSGESFQSKRNTFKPGNFNSIRLFVQNNGDGTSKGKAK